MKKSRDDFSEKIKTILYKRVALKCSNPDCRAATSGPNTIDTKSTIIGVAAHITAASNNGPRYNPDLNPEQRKSIDNAIWLCQNCAKLIDSDINRYTEEVLREWKKNSEDEALKEIGKPARDQGDFTKNKEELEKVKEILKPFCCPYCNARLVGKEHFFDTDGEIYGVEFDIIAYECGLTLHDEKEVNPCGNQKPKEN